MENMKVKMLGVYPFSESEPIYMVELMIDDSPSAVDASLFLQEDSSLPESDWQAAYDERYLNLEGTEIVGDYFNRAKLSGEQTRMVFFMFLENLAYPLSTPYGKIAFGTPQNPPQRLERIITYNPMD